MSASLTQITRCRPYVRSLIDTGFYSEIPMHRGVVERVELAGGYTVELSLSGMYLMALRCVKCDWLQPGSY